MDHDTVNNHNNEDGFTAISGVDHDRYEPNHASSNTVWVMGYIQKRK